MTVLTIDAGSHPQAAPYGSVQHEPPYPPTPRPPYPPVNPTPGPVWRCCDALLLAVELFVVLVLIVDDRQCLVAV